MKKENQLKNSKMKEDVAYILGAIFGDGTVYKSKSSGSYRVVIDQKKETWIGIMKEKFSKLGLKSTIYPFTWNGYTKWRIMVSVKELYELGKETKENPIGVLNKMSINEVLNFIAGLFDADGSITDRINIYNKNKELLEFLRNKLKEVNINVNIYKYGKVYGIYIYKKSEKDKFVKMVPFQTKRNLLLAENKND